MNTNNNYVAFTAPHFAAAQTGQTVLEHGGTAIEAMVAAAASIAVEYPHMNGLGGDGFWLISEPGKTPVGIDASGVSATNATPSFYQGLEHIPSRGGKAALTMAGAVSGWQKALEISKHWQQPLSLGELLAPAIGQAKWGIEITQSLQDASNKTFADLSKDENFNCFLQNGNPLTKGKSIKLSKLANTLEQLSETGLQDFYQGDIARSLAVDLQQSGSPIQLKDFNQYQANIVEPLKAKTSFGSLYNLPAPTQGIASLLILALFDKLKHQATTEVDMVHLIIECTKQAFIVRNNHVTDPSRTNTNFADFLTEPSLQTMADSISMSEAAAWPHEAKQGDTIWMGACDQDGRMVSYIQSLYWEFGSGVVSPSTGIVWNNRGTSFSLDPNSIQLLKPGLRPFHTLNPAFAELKDGRRLSYGTMGGEGQPQTQAALFCRYVFQQLSITKAIANGRWLLGRTWGDTSNNLKIEADLNAQIGKELLSRGHDIQVVAACNELMGHAGAVVQYPNGTTDASSDPRSDGKAFSG